MFGSIWTADTGHKRVTAGEILPQQSTERSLFVIFCRIRRMTAEEKLGIRRALPHDKTQSVSCHVLKMKNALRFAVYRFFIGPPDTGAINFGDWRQSATIEVVVGTPDWETTKCYAWRRNVKMLFSQRLRHVFMIAGEGDITVHNLIQTGTTSKNYTLIPSAMFNEYIISSTMHHFPHTGIFGIYPHNGCISGRAISIQNSN